MADDKILQKEDRNCVKRKLSVVGDVFHFLFDCPTCTHYRTRFVPRRFLQTPLTLLFLSSTKQKERERGRRRRNSGRVKSCMGHGNYVTSQTTATGRYYCTNILRVYIINHCRELLYFSFCTFTHVV